MKYTQEDVDKMTKALHEEIIKRDKIIDKLKNENLILMRTALEKAERKIQDASSNKKDMEDKKDNPGQKDT